MFTRICPNCDKKLSYTTERSLIRANIRETVCRGCSNSEIMEGTKRSSKTKKRISDWMKGKRNGKKHPMYGKHHSSKSKMKMRLSALKYIENQVGCVRIGKNEKLLLDEQEKKDGVRILRQWDTKLGYVVDGYCPETNTIYEVYEKNHTYPLQKIRDRKRKRRIINYARCKFVIIWDNL